MIILFYCHLKDWPSSEFLWELGPTLVCSLLDEQIWLQERVFECILNTHSGYRQNYCRWEVWADINVEALQINCRQATRTFKCNAHGQFPRSQNICRAEYCLVCEQLNARVHLTAQFGETIQMRCKIVMHLSKQFNLNFFKKVKTISTLRMT